MFPALILATCSLMSMTASSPAQTTLRPPAVPLFAHDPYFSIWSPSEKLAEADTEHWTHAPHHVSISATIDGKVFRLLGNSKSTDPAMRQTNLEVRPTQVIASYEDHGVELDLTFLSATICTDLDLLSQPLSYVIWSVKSSDGKKHKVEVKVETNGMIAAARGSQKMDSDLADFGDLRMAFYGTVDQPVLETKGDRTQIDWGRFYVGGPRKFVTSVGVTGKSAESLRAEVMYESLDVGSKAVSQYAVMHYDDDYSIEYFEQHLRPYWRRDGVTAADLLENASKRLPAIQKQCDAFDKELMADFEKVGGSLYTQLSSLAYRQCIAGSKLAADPNGQPLWFPKENSSNGCMATTDVIYPMSPQAFLFGPALTKAMLQPVLAYGSSPRWKFDFAPHDLGTYPQANGQVYGGGERTEENQMPVEESANMLIMMAALAKMEGNADYAEKFWPTLTKWAQYLVKEGFNPDNQLCTDDFLGHLAQNVNLSAKAIMGIRSYARLCEMLGREDDAVAYRTTAENFAAKWVREASDSESTRLTFDKPGTWSQKYNLVWDSLLGFDLFSDAVKQKEMDWYLKNLNAYGLPIDSRGNGAKLDWNIWIATLTQDRGDFEALMAGVYKYVNETPNRIGLGDWYNTENGHLNFFEARPVMGGALIPLLYDDQIWQKWAKRSKTTAANWAAIPPKPVITEIVPITQIWQYTTVKPAEGWNGVTYNDSGWKSGKAGFGTDGTPGAQNGTLWNTSDIWIRRSFELKSVPENIQLMLHHDDDVEVYVNGVLAFKRSGWTSDYEAKLMSPASLKALRPGQNTIAIYCHQNQGGQYIDAGFVVVEPGKK